MIDLSKYLNRTLEVRLKDKTIHVYDPSLEMVKEYFEKESTEPLSAFVDTQKTLVMQMINRNKEKITVKPEEVEKFPRSFVLEICRSLMVNADSALSDPN